MEFDHVGDQKEVLVTKYAVNAAMKTRCDTS